MTLFVFKYESIFVNSLFKLILSPLLLSTIKFITSLDIEILFLLKKFLAIFVKV